MNCFLNISLILNIYKPKDLALPISNQTCAAEFWWLSGSFCLSFFADVEIMVLRHGGDMGIVMVNYTTLKPSDFYSFLPLVVGRAGAEDFVQGQGTVVFQPMQTNGTFSVG